MSNVVTNGQKLNVEGHDFTLVDLRDSPSHYQDDGSYFGSKRGVMITSDGLGDREDFSEAIECKNGDKFYIDGKLYHLVVKDVNACEGVIFITDSTFKSIKRLLGV